MGDTKANKTLSLDQLIAKKTQRDAAKIAYKNLMSKSLDGELLAKKPDRETAIEYMDDMTSCGESVKEIYLVCKDVVYNSIKMLQKTELHEAYNCSVPDQIVDELLEIEEVIDMGTKIIDWNEEGVEEAKKKQDEEVKEEIKNS